MTEQTQQNSIQIRFQPANQIVPHALNEEGLSTEQLIDLEILLKKQRSRLTHFIRKHLKRDEQVEDVLQQTHMAAFRGWGRFRGDSRPETWLFGIAMNLVRNARTRDVSHYMHAEDSEEQLVNLPADSCEEPFEVLARHERIERLRHAIQKLPTRMQAAVQLVFLEGLSYQDAAEELDLPIGTIRSRLARARDILRTTFNS